ncbi:MAG: MaoC family dehydratase N-terminal domain-containing protein, partial [Deltaproteobacteria bacterium]|nr:MaoC family dehydratase N-terminal domain-containing protein [Deltaproteobacteria bacterium]
MSEILASLFTRTQPLSPDEISQLIVEIGQARTPLAYEERLEDVVASGILGRSGYDVAQFQQRARWFRTSVTEKNLTQFDGYVGIDSKGLVIDPKNYRFSGIPTNNGIAVYVSDDLKPVAESILAKEQADFQPYFAAAYNTVRKTLALAQVLIDHKGKSFGITEEQRTLFAWELLARVDYDLQGATDPSWVLGHHNIIKDYEKLKAFVELSGLHPMSQRALDIRDGREKPFALFAGNGSNYLAELRQLVETEPSAKALYNELKRTFAKYLIDLDALLLLADADQGEIETYYKVNGIATSLPVVALAQVLRARVMEDYGYDFSQFAGVSAQSGGLPAAYFVAGAFEQDDYTPPLLPQGIGGTHTIEAYRHFVEWMLVEGRLMQKPNPIRYAPDVTRMEPLIKRGEPLPTADQIDAYFAKYHVTNMAISGVPYYVTDHDAASPAWVVEYPQSDLAKVIKAINSRYPDGSSYVFMSNLNTGATTTGKRSYFVLMGGKGSAMADLAKLLVTKDAPGYSEKIQAIVAGWRENPNVGLPITNTRVSFAPHDTHDLQASLDEHMATMRQLGIEVSRPRIPVVHNWTGANDQLASGDYALILARQQYVEQVDMPTLVEATLPLGGDITSIIDLGTGNYLSATAVPTILDGSPVDITGVAGKDGDGVDGWTRLTSTDPRLAHTNHWRPSPQVQATALDQLKEIAGLTVKTEPVADSVEMVRVRFDSQLADENFEQFKELFFQIGGMSPLIALLGNAKVIVYGKEEANPIAALLRNQPNFEYELSIEADGRAVLRILERGLHRMTLDFSPEGSGIINVEEYTYPIDGRERISLQRRYRKTDTSFEQVDLDRFRADTRRAYALDWELKTRGIRKEQTFADKQIVTTGQMIHFAVDLQTRDEKYLNREHPEFQAHPHFLIELMWKAMITPAFVGEFDLDFTRVIDEGKSIRFEAPIKAGDTIRVKAQIARVEDFRMGGYEGRRVIVRAVATNQNGEVVGEVTSTLVSRIPTGLADKETRVLYANDAVSETIDFFDGKTVYENKEVHLVAQGTLKIPETLADTYTVDPNRIHVSDLSAAMAGMPKSRVMQGLATLAYVNEQVVSQLQRDGLARDVRGISDLRFSGFVLPGDELTYEISRKATAEGDHRFEVVVKKAGGGKVMSYTVVAQGVKTALVFTGQGSQYVGMGNDLIADPVRKATLEEL